MRIYHRILARILLAGIVIQLAAASILHIPVAAHALFGALLALLAFVLAVLAVLAHISRATIVLSVLMPALFLLQLVSISLDDAVPAMIYVHLSNAVLILLVAIILVLHLADEAGDQNAARAAEYRHP